MTNQKLAEIGIAVMIIIGYFSVFAILSNMEIKYEKMDVAR